MALSFKNLLPWMAVTGAGIWAARRPEQVRRGLHSVADRFGDVVDDLSDAAEPWIDRVGSDVLPKFRDSIGNAALSAHDVAEPLMGTVSQALANALRHGSEWGGDAIDEIEDRLADAPRTARQAFKFGARGAKQVRESAVDALERIPKGVMKRMEKGREKELLAHLIRQEKMAHDMKKKIDRVASMGYGRRGGGLPWSWVLLGAGAYYLYRNPDVIQRALDSISPNAGRHLEAAGDAVKGGVKRVQGGADVVDAAKDAVQEASSEIGKAAKDAKAQAEHAVDAGKDAAKAAAKDVKQGAQAVGDQVSDTAKDVARDTKRMAS